MDKSLLDHYEIFMAVLSHGVICFSSFSGFFLYSAIDAELLFPRKPTPFSDQSDGSLPFSAFVSPAEESQRNICKCYLKFLRPQDLCFRLYSNSLRVVLTMLLNYCYTLYKKKDIMIITTVFRKGSLSCTHVYYRFMFSWCF